MNPDPTTPHILLPTIRDLIFFDSGGTRRTPSTVFVVVAIRIFYIYPDWDLSNGIDPVSEVRTHAQINRFSAFRTQIIATVQHQMWRVLNHDGKF